MLNMNIQQEVVFNINEDRGNEDFKNESREQECQVESAGMLPSTVLASSATFAPSRPALIISQLLTTSIRTSLTAINIASRSHQHS